MSAGNGAGRRRVLVVGLDAATFDLVLPWARSGALPTIGRLLREGAYAPLRSTLPALTPPGWTSAATGRNPGQAQRLQLLPRARGWPESRTGHPRRSAQPPRVGHRGAGGSAQRRAAHAAHVPAAGARGRHDLRDHDAEGRRRLRRPRGAEGHAGRSHLRLSHGGRRQPAQAGGPRDLPPGRVRPAARADRGSPLPDGPRGVGPLLGDDAHARQAAALLLALHGPRTSRVSGRRRVRARDPRLSRGVRPLARRA